jgi:hypothetical protein
MNDQERIELILKFKIWFKDSLIDSHLRNTNKLTNLEEFQINPLLLYYLANYLEGNSDPKSLAKVLIYPRILGTSINTTFGQLIQGQFITKVLGGYASVIRGLDIEFIDQIDGRRKYCQLKSGPNSLNFDDVQTIKEHFREIKARARVNKSDIQISDLVFCLVYGELSEKNSFVQKLEEEHIVYIGREFWHRFTGDPNFYNHLILAAGELAKEINMKVVVDEVINNLSYKIEEKFEELYKIKT